MHRAVASFGLGGLSALLLSGCATIAPPAAVAAAPASERTVQALPAGVTSELPRNAAPRHYAIAFEPDMAALTFTATAAIDLTVFAETDTLVLNANNLEIASARLIGPDDQVRTLSAGPISESHTVGFAADAPIAPGDYRLQLAYAGTINTQANGLFVLDYPDKRTGKDVQALFTQFEVPDARSFVPSFDEPSYKATFDLTATVPSGLMALSNMPAASETELGDGTKRVVFATTPVMSSYLLFFGLGDFERTAKMAANGVEAGIVAPKGSGEQARYALDSLAEIMPYFDDYFGVKFPLPKIDNIAGPGSSQFFGAMENWGAVFTFERLLLDDPAITSASTRQDIYVVQAHEVAHQWFGDLVTMRWWDDLWLNEGFASWMESKATADLHPEWDYLMNRVSGREAAMDLDAYATTHPIVQSIPDVSGVEQAFDTIAYQKGEAVVSMLEAYAGEDIWRDGIRLYMRDHAYGNTTSADLWNAVGQAGAPGVAAVAHDYTMQPGVPLVRLESAACVDGKSQIALSQSEFSADRKDAATADPKQWHVPLNLRIGASGGKPGLLTDGSGRFTVDGCGALVVNGGQRGYFRTLYTPAALQAITAEFGTLAPIDQYGLLRDNLALSLAEYQPMAAGLDLLLAVPEDASGILASSALSRYAEFYELLDDAAQRQKLADLAAVRWLPRLSEVGFDPVAGETYAASELRTALIGKLGAMGNPVVLAEAGRRFAQLADDPTALDGPQKTLWLGLIAGNATRAQWDLLRRLANEATNAVERGAYFKALGQSSDPELAAGALALALTGEPPKTEAATIIGRVAKNHPELAWDFVAAHREQISQLVDRSGRAQFFASIGSDADTPAMLAKVTAYRDSLPVDERSAADETVAEVKNRVENNPRIRQGIGNWLGKLAGFTKLRAGSAKTG